MNSSIHGRLSGGESIRGSVSGVDRISGQLHTQPVGSNTYQGYDLSDLVHGTEVQKVIKLTQTEFDSLLLKDPETLYVVVGG